MAKSKDQQPAKFIDEGSPDEVDQDFEPETPPAAPTPPKHDPGLVELARYYGLTQAETDGMTSDQLVRQVGRMQAYAARRDEQIFNNLRQQQQPREPEPKAEPADEFDWGEDEYEDMQTGATRRRKTTDADLPAPLVRMMRRHADELKALKAKYGEVDEIKRSVQGREMADYNDAVDGGFEDLGETYHGVFGEGPLAGLEEDGPEHAFRNMVVRKVASQFREAGKKPSLKQIRIAVAAEAKRQFEKVVGGRGKAGPGPGEQGPRYADDDLQYRKPQATRPRGEDNLFLSDAQIAKQAEEKRIRQMYESGGSEQPASRGAGKPKPSRANAVEGVEELMRSWGDQDDEPADRNGFVP